ncbi:MAG: hypothetical protein E7302_04705 [Butyrivibrio sp.]|nr:hypothetical protein [Butyrivibrio sp.]
MRKGLLKRVVAIALAAAMTFGGELVAPQFAQTAHAMEIVEGVLPVVNSADEGASVSAVFTQQIKLDDYKNDGSDVAKGYFKFNVNQDSWVHFAGSYAFSVDVCVGSDVTIYSDPSFSNKVLDYQFGYGYWRKKKETAAFLKKGTYYGYVCTVHENHPVFDGNMNIVAYAVPVSKIVNPKMSKKKGKTIVTFADSLGSYTNGVQYINKSVAKSQLGRDQSTWRKKVFSSWIGGDKKTKMMKTNSAGKYTFTAKKAGKYTAMIEDIYGNRYQRTFKVKVKK